MVGRNGKMQDAKRRTQDGKAGRLPGSPAANKDDPS